VPYPILSTTAEDPEGSTAVAEVAKKIVPEVPDGDTDVIASGVGRATPVDPLLFSWTR
jgi:hypothetical protein